MNLIERSYHQPKLPPSTCWNPYAITFARGNDFTHASDEIFVGKNSSVYTVDRFKRVIHVWRQGSRHITNTSFKTNFIPASLFVTIGGDIFVAASNGSVEKWASNVTKGVGVTTFEGECFSLFIDTMNNLYCSLRDKHRVMKQILDVGANISTTVAGTGIAGSTPGTLNFPSGIFVDINLDLYVADCRNNRVQLFKDGQNNGVTVAGHSKALSITLQCPTRVFLDGNNDLFILDKDNHRIVRSSPHGFDCVVGCSTTSGEESHHLYHPRTAAFDNLGNIFVGDWNNERIQKFLLIRNNFGK